jgi:hypothetical protein
MFKMGKMHDNKKSRADMECTPLKWLWKFYTMRTFYFYWVSARLNVSLLWKNDVFSWVPFIQMHMVINISLDLLIGTWIYINNFIMKTIMWLFID